MIEFQNITKRYGAQDVLVNVSFQINPSNRIGIVGPNGGGKSTLFKLITGEIAADEGSVVMPKNLRLGHVRQQPKALSDDTTLISFTEASMPHLQKITEQLTRLESEIHALAGQQRETAIRRLGDLQSKFEHDGGYEMRSRAEAALSGLGFREHEFDRPFESFSGGWRMRAELVRVLIGNPDTLLLDEPSNYLDVPAIEWLRRYLRDFTGTLLLISHDRYLLESLAELTFEVNGGNVTRYAGGFAYYERERVSRREHLAAAHKSQERKREQMERFIERFRAKNTKASAVQSRIKMLERMEDVVLPEEISDAVKIRIAPPPHCGVEVVRLESLGHTYDGNSWILRGIDLTVNRGDKVALVGYNGMGKTTLLRCIAGEVDIAAGRRVLGHHVVPGYQSQEFAETMSPNTSLFRIVKSASPDTSDKEVRSILGSFGFSGDAVDKTCGILSGGEKIRLAFARIFVRPPNLLILDEPTTHLDLNGRRALESALAAYEGTLVLVSHDIEFVRNVANLIVAMEPPGIRPYAGGYDYYVEKSREFETGTVPAPARAAKPAEGGTANRKAQRKQRAEEREARRRREREIKRTISQAEKRIEALETEQAELVEAMGSGAAQDHEQINRRLREIQADLNIWSREWESAVDTLQTISETGTDT